MKLPTLLTLATVSLGLTAATPQHTSYTLHKRLVDPSVPSAPFQPYGTVETDIQVSSYALALEPKTGTVVPPSGRFVPVEKRAAGVAGEVGLDTAWVQVAVEVEGKGEDQWPTSVVRACHLVHATQETITLHLSTHSSSSSSGELESPHPLLQPYAITYRLPTNETTNECPEEMRGIKVPLDWDGHASRNVQVVLKTKEMLHGPRLTSSPALNIQGTGAATATPPVQQSFLQKYWIYIAGAGVAVLLMGTQEPQAGEAGKAGAR